MNTDQLSKMTPEEKRIAIAELCNLDVIRDPAGPKDRPEAWKTGFFTPRAAKQRRIDFPSSAAVKIIPDYLNSLDAITIAVRDTITDKVQQANFAENLVQILNRKFDGQHRFLGATPFHVATAEPADLCDAFLLTMLPESSTSLNLNATYPRK